MAAPRRTQDRTGTRSTTSASLGHHASRWQKIFVVRGQVSRALRTIPLGPRGTRSRYGKDESPSGLRAMRKSSTGSIVAHRWLFWADPGCRSGG